MGATSGECGFQGSVSSATLRSCMIESILLSDTVVSIFITWEQNKNTQSVFCLFLSEEIYPGLQSSL